MVLVSKIRQTFKTSLCLSFLCGSLHISPIHANDLSNDLVSTTSQILQTENGVVLKMNGDGFKVVSQEILNFINTRVANMSFPDQEFQLTSRTRIKGRGIRILPNLLKFQLTPQADKLRLELVFINLQLEVEQLQMLYGASSKMTAHCEGWNIDLGNHNSLPASAEMGVRLENGEFRLSLGEVNLNILPHQYHVAGPKSCTGPLGGSAPLFLKRFISYLTQHTRSYIEKMIKGMAAELVIRLEKELNSTFVQNFPIKTPAFGPIPEAHLLIGMIPKKFQFSPEGVDIVLSTKLAFNDRHGLTDWESVEDEKEGMKNLVILGEKLEKVWDVVKDEVPVKRLKSMTEIGVHHALLNQFSQIIFKNGGAPVEVQRTWAPVFKTMTSKEELANYWPDLENVPDESPFVRLFLKLTKAPLINSSAIVLNPGEFSMVLPEVELLVKVLSGGVWQDYYKIFLSFEGKAMPRILEETFFPTISNIKYSFRGEWASTYHPRDPLFDSDSFNESVQLAVNFMDNDSTRDIGAKLPPFKAGKSEFVLNKLAQDGPYWFLGF
jgi:hypothetical protein